MTDDLQTIWRAVGSADGFTEPEELKSRMSMFERRIRRRNMFEYAAGGMLLCFEIPAFAMYVSLGETLMAGAMLLMVVGTLLVLLNLYRRASMQRRRPEEDCRSHLVAQYRRQAEALRTVPLWYIGPLLPGVLGVYGMVAAKAVGTVGAGEILADMGLPFGATLAFFGFVIWLNLRAARGLKQQADALEAA